MNNIMIGAIKKQPKHIFNVYEVIGISEEDGLPIFANKRTLSIRMKDSYEAKQSLLRRLNKNGKGKYYDATLVETVR
jgi:hypothetical protein